MIDKALIEKYLRGECPEEEAADVMLYLQQHPHAIEELLPEEEWNKYINTPPSSAFDEDMYQNIQQAVQDEKRNKRVIISVVSAAVVLLLFFGIRYLDQASNTNQVAAVNREIVKKNTVGSDQVIILPDSSIVMLAASSEIRYAADYNVSKRDIYLTGKAEFSVAPNKQKQFTVFCGKVATTALGTRFSVDGAAKTISVILYEGKVVVKKVQDETVANFLSPGDKISFNIKKDMFEKFHHNEWASNVSEKYPSAKSHVEKEMAPDTGHRSDLAAESELADNKAHINFRNQNLKSVLTQLAERFNVEINYPTEISSSINVLMSVDTTQSIDKILQNIAIINNLEVKKLADRKFYISK